MLSFNEINEEENSFSEDLKLFLSKRNSTSSEVASKVSTIISEIRHRGDDALKAYSKEFDNFDKDSFLASKKEIDLSLKHFDPDLMKSLEFSFENILKFQTQCFKSLNLENSDKEITRKFRIIDSVGVYVPGGKASYPSTVLMGSAPAIACGVKNISLTSPAQNGVLNSRIVAAAKVAGINTIYKMGGAQAIAALALGTEQVAKVEKIVGPGNVFVAEAKKQLFGEVGIDSIAGPSEIVVLADETSDPEIIAWDLMAQAEHDPDASSVLICNSEGIITKVKDVIKNEIESLERGSIITESINSKGLIIKIQDLSQAKNIINMLAPEHLHLSFDHENFRDENELIAGLILKGRDSANSFSDYVLGPSHILPTNSSAKFSSPLSIEDFLVSYSYVSLNKNNDIKKFQEYVEHTSRIANAEGLTAHAVAAEKRLKD